MERAAGIEPACLTWKDSALPLSYARDFVDYKTRVWSLKQDFFGGFPKLFELFLNVRAHLISKYSLMIDAPFPIFFKFYGEKYAFLVAQMHPTPESADESKVLFGYGSPFGKIHNSFN